jgi:hypothetical protein
MTWSMKLIPTQYKQMPCRMVLKHFGILLKGNFGIALEFQNFKISNSKLFFPRLSLHILQFLLAFHHLVITLLPFTFGLGRFSLLVYFGKDLIMVDDIVLYHELQSQSDQYWTPYNTR